MVAREQMDPRLQERVVQYEMAAAIALEFMQEIGKEQALPVIQRALDKMQVCHGERMAQQLGSNSHASRSHEDHCRRR